MLEFFQLAVWLATRHGAIRHTELVTGQGLALRLDSPTQYAP